MDGRRPRFGLPALGIAAGGVLVGHWLTYLIVRPDHHDRASLLASTGHGYLAAAVEVALLVGLVAAAAAFLSRLVGGNVAPGLRSLASRLGAFQLGAFVVLEVAERAVAGSFDGLLAVCLVGAVAQSVSATAGAWLLRRLERAADAAVSLLGRPARTAAGRATARNHLAAATDHRSPALAAAGIRGPPSLG